MPTWLKRAIIVSAIITAYAIGVATAGWSPYWVSVIESRSSWGGHKGGGFCPSDSRLIEIFQVELQTSIQRIERHTVNSCEFGWAMVQVTIFRSNQTNVCVVLLQYDNSAQQWYARDMNWIGSSDGHRAEV